MKKLFLTFACLVLLSVAVAAAQAKTPPQAAVVSAHPLATAAGQRILSEGGNAFDAAVAVAAILGVVEPFSSGIGGGGFWLVYDAQKDAYLMLDARETAPAAARAEIYLDENGNPDPDLLRNGPLAAGIPGSPAALQDIAKTYGTMPLSALLAPAIAAAREGFAVDARYVNGARHKQDILRRYPASAAIFLDHGNVPEDGWILKQPDLAATLEMIAEKGAEAFYQGDFAEKMLRDAQKHGGNWTAEDLQNYKTVMRTPVTGEYRGAKIISAAPPSSGGIVLVNALNILSGFDLAAKDSATRVHLIVEAMRRAYRMRAQNLGDPDFADIPQARLLSAEFAAEQRSTILPDRATPSDIPDLHLPHESEETTHFAVIDRAGNRVAVTRTVNLWFGSGFVPEGTGVLLNNEMDDFSVKPGVENAFGLIGFDANAVEGGKRMLSSMSPTFVESDRGALIIGTPGGSRIISMVLLGILDFLDGHEAEEIAARPRFHHQYLPDEIVYERAAFTEEDENTLRQMGHTLSPAGRYGNMQIILWDYATGRVEAVSDPRGSGAGEVY